MDDRLPTGRCSFDLPSVLANDPIIAGIARRAASQDFPIKVSIGTKPPSGFALRINGGPVSEDLDRSELLSKLLASVVGAAPMPRHAVRLSSAAVSKGKNAVLLAGPRGNGVTSTAAWFVSCGFDYLADLSIMVQSKSVSGFAVPLQVHRSCAKEFAALDRIGTAPAAFLGDNVLFDPNDDWCAIGQKTLRLIVFPQFKQDAGLRIEMLPAFQSALRMMAAAIDMDCNDTRQMGTIVDLAAAVPSVSVTFGRYEDLDGVVDRMAKLTIAERLTPYEFGRFFGGFYRTHTPRIYPVPQASQAKPPKRFTIGMATYDDYDGVYFSLQSIRLHHPEILDDVEFLIVDNHPDGPCGAPLKDLEKSIPNLRYLPVTDTTGTAIRDRIFREASGEFVVCMDCHILFPAGSLKRLFEYFDAKPKTADLLQGPLIYDNLTKISTHFDPKWSRGMFGTWGTDEAGIDLDAPPFEIPMQGLGVFACRRAAWPGFNPSFRGFGGEEGYIHEKFRQAGGKVLCLPFLRWLHRFGRPLGVPYRNNWEDRFWNYFIGFREIGWPTDGIESHMKELLGDEPARRMISKLKAELDGAPAAEGLVVAEPEPPALPDRVAMRERLHCEALAEVVSGVAQGVAIWLKGETAQGLKGSLQAKGNEVIGTETWPEDRGPAGAAISLLAISNDSPSQAKRHVASLTAAASVVLFASAQSAHNRGRHGSADDAYWEELFARRGYTPSAAFRSRIAADTRIEQDIRKSLQLFSREPVEIRAPNLTAGDYRNGVSVILPVFNGGEFVEQAIHSILLQTHREFEFIIVDDGSTDTTAEIAETYARCDDRIRLIRQANRGEADAANAAMYAAKYPLIARIDHDDVSFPERLQRQVSFMNANPDVAAVGTFMQPIDRHGKACAALMRYPVRPADCKTALADTLVAPIGNPSAMIRAEAMRKVSGYRTQFRCAADFDFWLRLGATYAMGNIPEVLVAYRMHGDSTSSSRRVDQRFHARLARLSADCRNRNLPDPLDGKQKLEIEHLQLFDMTPRERLECYQDLYQTAAGSIRQAKQESNRAAAFECLRLGAAIPAMDPD